MFGQGGGGKRGREERGILPYATSKRAEGKGTPKGERGHLVRREKTFLSAFASKVKDL